MTPLKRVGTGSLVALFIFISMGYAFFNPFVPGAVLDAIPAQATFTYRADRLKVGLESPVCAQINPALGPENSLAELLASNPWMGWVAPSEIAVANLPFRQAGQSPAWLAVSWVGWRSPWLRWKLEHTRTEGLSFLGKHAVWPIWNYQHPDFAAGKSLTFALTDRLFIACLSENPSDILLLINTYDRRHPSVVDTQRGSRHEFP